jgi:hypothetical protein
MNLRALLFCLLISTSTHSFSQDSTFYIDLPIGWIQTHSRDLLKLMKNDFQFSNEEKYQILSNVTIVQTFKYAAPDKTGSLYRPNIEVLLIKNQTVRFSQFRFMMEKRFEGLKGKINELKILESLSEFAINGKRSLYAKITGYLQTKNGDKAHLITRIYAVPSGKYFYLITMSDSGNYTCEDEFKKVLASLRL